MDFFQISRLVVYSMLCYKTVSVFYEAAKETDREISDRVHRTKPHARAWLQLRNGFEWMDISTLRPDYQHSYFNSSAAWISWQNPRIGGCRPMRN